MASTSPKAIVRSSRHVSCLGTIYRIYSDLYKIDLSDASTLIFDEFILLLLESLHLLGHQRHIAHWRAEYHVVKNYVSLQRPLDIVGIPPLSVPFKHPAKQDHAREFLDNRLAAFTSEQLQNDPDLRDAFRHAYQEAASFDVLCRPLSHFQATLFPATPNRSSTQSSGLFPDLPSPPSPQYAKTSVASVTKTGFLQVPSDTRHTVASLEPAGQFVASYIQSINRLTSKVLLLKKRHSFYTLATHSLPLTPKDSTFSLVLRGQGHRRNSTI